MSVTDIMIVLAVVWPTVGLVVAVLLGSMFRAANVSPENFADRLIC